MPVVNAFINILRRLRYPGSARYWQRRYARGGNSGSGSAGPLARYKADFLNRFVREHDIRSVVEYGCGDGRQLQLADYPQYTGLDIAPAAVARCQTLFAADATKRFAVYDPFSFQPADFQAELALSLEVVFHLTENDLYERHLRHLFASARRRVVIFAADEDRATPFPHFRPRRFTPDAARLAPDWRLIERVENPLGEWSVSQFFVFEKSNFN